MMNGQSHSHHGFAALRSAAVAALALIVLAAGCRDGDSTPSETYPPPEVACGPAVGATELEAFADPATPRPDAAAEKLVLEATGRPSADSGVYERVTGDLAALASAWPDDTGTGVRTDCWNPGSILVEMTEAAIGAVRAGTYSEWNDYNATLGVTEIDVSDSTRLVRIDFDGRYHGAHLLHLYYDLSGVARAEPNSLVGDGDDTCLEIEGERHYYVFDHASGDCPSGCIEHRYVGFETDSAGNMTRLGETGTKDGADWIVDLDECRTFL